MHPHNGATQPENFEETLAHARAGYANAQDIIKFIDTKIAVVTSLITVSLGLPFLFIQWLGAQREASFLSLQDISEQSPISSALALFVVIVGIGS